MGLKTVAGAQVMGDRRSFEWSRTQELRYADVKKQKMLRVQLRVAQDGMDAGSDDGCGLICQGLNLSASAYYV